MTVGEISRAIVSIRHIQRIPYTASDTRIYLPAITYAISIQMKKSSQLKKHQIFIQVSTVSPTTGPSGTTD
jgi:hypothetical protein